MRLAFSAENSLARTPTSSERALVTSISRSPVSRILRIFCVSVLMGDTISCCRKISAVNRNPMLPAARKVIVVRMAVVPIAVMVRGCRVSTTAAGAPAMSGRIWNPRTVSSFVVTIA